MNGFYCTSCADVDFAERLRDPASRAEEYGAKPFPPLDSIEQQRLELSGHLGTKLNVMA